MNGVKLTLPEFIGNYYENRTLKVFTPEHGWKATITYGNGTVRTLTINNNLYELPLTSAHKNIQLEVDENQVITDITDIEQRDITVTVLQGNVCVESASPLKDVTVVDIAGRTVASLPGGDFVAQLQLPAHGLYIVTATNATGRTVSKKVNY